MSALIQGRDPRIPLQHACAALQVSRATLYRHHARPALSKPPCARRSSPRRLSAPERQAVLQVLHEPRFVDQPPAQVYAKLLDEGRHLCSLRTMHQRLAEKGESGERRLVSIGKTTPLFPRSGS